MTVAFPKPYIASLIVNFYNHVLQGQALNNQGVPFKTVYGRQVESAEVGIDLYLTKTRNVGTQKFPFGLKESSPTDLHNGLPAMSTILTPEVRDAWLAAFNAAIDKKIPQYDGSNDTGASDLGPKTYFRINRLEAQLPYDKPAERFVSAFVGVYMDSEFKTQVLDADFSVIFVNDEFIRRKVGQELDAEQIAQARIDNELYSLSELLSTPAIQQGVVTMATNFFSTLKQRVPAYSDINVVKVMQEFGETFAEAAQ